VALSVSDGYTSHVAVVRRAAVLQHRRAPLPISLLG
jgi:hypothetical protein